MNRMYRKMILRSVRTTKTRFLSILAIVFLGAGFFAGLLVTSGDMELTLNEYFDENNTPDLDLKSGVGFNEDDRDAVAAMNGVQKVAGAYMADVTVTGETAGTLAARVTGSDLSALSSENYLNRFVLTEGRLPQKPDECVICIPNSTYFATYALGDVMTVDADNKYGALLAVDSFTVVGVAESPYSVSIEYETTTVGSGRISLFLFVGADAFAVDTYTDLFVLCNADGLDRFTDAYRDHVAEIQTQAEALAKERIAARYDSARKEYDANIALFSEKKQEFEEQTALYKTQFADEKAKLDTAALQLESLKETYEQGKDILPAEQLAVLQAQIEAADTAYAEGLAAYDDGLAQFNARMEESEALLVQAEQALADASVGLEKLQNGSWVGMTLQNNIGFSSYASNTRKIDSIAKVFPAFLFLVAALVALTTMTRMVDEERVQIGTLKALGYSAGKITAYYLGYASLASLAGAFLGCLVGFKLLPAVIAGAYGMMYVMPPVETPIWWLYLAGVTVLSTLCVTLAAYAACRSALREKPCALMLPKVPKAGKRIFLEHIGFLWKRMKFTYKVTARNILRYKKRFFMTTFGLAGCMALLVTGFGLKTSINAIVDRQFDEINRYDLTVRLTERGLAAEDFNKMMEDPSDIASYAVFHSESVYAEKDGVSLSVTALCPQNTDDLKKFVNLRTRSGQKDIPFANGQVVLTEKLCEQLGLSVGDSFTLRNTEGTQATLKVSAITENYISRFIYFTAADYTAAYGRESDGNTILARTGNNITNEAARNSFSTAMLASGGAVYTQFSEEIRSSFGDMVKNLDYIVMVLIIAAAALCVIVVYNLTNINICERKKELATIKVLGFYNREVAYYVYRETGVLCILGVLLGCGLGKLLHTFVIRTAEIDAVMFGRFVSIDSYLLAAAVTIVFTVLVDLLMVGKLRRIDMVESLKSTE